MQLIAGWLVKFVITTSLATAGLKINARKNIKDVEQEGSLPEAPEGVYKVNQKS